MGDAIPLRLYHRGIHEVIKVRLGHVTIETICDRCPVRPQCESLFDEGYSVKDLPKGMQEKARCLDHGTRG